MDTIIAQIIAGIFLIVAAFVSGRMTRAKREETQFKIFNHRRDWFNHIIDRLNRVRESIDVTNFIPCSPDDPYEIVERKNYFDKVDDIIKSKMKRGKPIQVRRVLSITTREKLEWVEEKQLQLTKRNSNELSKNLFIGYYEFPMQHIPTYTIILLDRKEIFLGFYRTSNKLVIEDKNIWIKSTKLGEAFADYYNTLYNNSIKLREGNRIYWGNFLSIKDKILKKVNISLREPVIQREFRPRIINESYFKEKNINVVLSSSDLRIIEETSREYLNDFENMHKELIRIKEEKIPLDFQLKIHDNTNLCPKNMRELNPAYGSCFVGCRYCLVNDGLHNQPVFVIENYPEYVHTVLTKNTEKNIVFEFSGKTEILQKPLLETGLTHKILLAFEKHYKKNPESQNQLFIVTKMGINECKCKYNGESVIDILKRIKKFVQLNSSIVFFPPEAQKILEPNAPTIDERFALISECQKQGIEASAILMQPLLEPFFSVVELRKHLEKFKEHNIKIIKPEFLTLTLKNMVGLFPILGFINPDWEKELFERRLYSVNIHTKNSRIAPNPQYIKEQMLLIKKVAKEYNIIVSICSWVRQATDMPDFNKEAEEKNYLCVACQNRMLERLNSN